MVNVISTSFQTGLFEDIAEGLKNARIVIACLSDDVSHNYNLLKFDHVICLIISAITLKYIFRNCVTIKE